MWAGLRNEVVDIMRYTNAPNEYGEIVKTLTKEYTLRAKVNHLSGSRTVRNDEIQYPYAKTFVLRYTPAIRGISGASRWMMAATWARMVLFHTKREKQMAAGSSSSSWRAMASGRFSSGGKDTRRADTSCSAGWLWKLQLMAATMEAAPKGRAWGESSAGMVQTGTMCMACFLMSRPRLIVSIKSFSLVWHDTPPHLVYPFLPPKAREW